MPSYSYYQSESFVSSPNKIMLFITENTMVEYIWWNRVSSLDHRMSLPRFGSQRDKQLVSNQVNANFQIFSYTLASPTFCLQSFIALSTTLFNLNDGTPSFWPVHNDHQLPRQPAPRKRFFRRIHQGHKRTRRSHLEHRPGCVLQETRCLLQFSTRRCSMGDGRTPWVASGYDYDGLRFSSDNKAVGCGEESGGACFIRVFRAGWYREAWVEYYADCKCKEVVMWRAWSWLLDFCRI